MFKRLLQSVSVVLTLALVFSIVTCAPFTVSAAETKELAATGTADTSVPFGEPSGGMYTLESTTYQLEDDVVLEGYLRIPEGVTAVIDLNGHTVDRGLSASASCSDFIRNEGTLTIIDSVGTGKLTGGYANQGGVVYNTGSLTIEGGAFVENRASLEAGAIFNASGATLTVTDGSFTKNTTETYGGGAFVNFGSMTLSGGTINGNIAKMDAGGIFNADGATLTVTGGTVTGNCAGRKNASNQLEGKAGGIYNSANGTLNMSGSPVIKDNANGNLWLGGDSIINWNSSLGDGAKIDVSADNMLGANNLPRTITSDIATNSPYTINYRAFTFASGNTQATLRGVDGGFAVCAAVDVNYVPFVSTWADLKTAIDNASNGDTIALSADIINPTQNASDPIVIENKNITIDLMGHTINRNRTSSHNDGHVIWVKGTSNVTLRDSAGGGALTGGYAENGGGINIAENATLNLYNVTVAGNTAEDGGGIYVHGTLNINGAVVFNNSATDDGGAIHINDDASAVSIKNALITGNSSDSQAGAIYHNKNITTSIEDSFILSNESNDLGGGIYQRTGAISMTGGAVSGNSTTEGGAVYTVEDMTFTANGTVFSGNEATTGSGGAIYAEGSLTLTGCTVKGNSSAAWGGGVYLPDNTGAVLTLNGGRIEQNTCANNGGGVHVSETASITVSGAPIVKNNTKGSNAVVNNIWLPGNSKTITVNSLTEGTEIGINAYTYNRVLATGLTSEDDLVYFAMDSESESVELTKSYDNGDMFVKRVNRVSISSWAALQNAINNAQYETIFTLSQTLNANGESAMRIPDGKTVTIDLKGYDLNRGLTSIGSAGHVIQMKGSSNLTIRDTSANHAGKVTGGWAEHGGGINLEASSTCTIESGNISGNHAKYGGGIWNKGTLTVKGGSVSENIASEEGGGIYGQGTTVLSDCSITGNTAKYGGGIYFDKKPNLQKTTNVTITGNTATTRGGGIFLQTGTVTLSGGSVSNNTSKDCGGVYVTDNTTLSAENTSFNNNKSTTESGGAIVNKGTVTLTSCTLDSNESKKRGGAIFSDDAELSLTNCAVTNNTTDGVGGGICMYDGTLNLVGGTITGNTGSQGGSGIWVDDDVDAFNVKGKVIVNNNNNSNIYLSSGKKLNINGALESGTQIGVTLQNVSGTFTTGYKTNNPETNPDVYFSTDAGSAIAADANGEVMVIESDWKFLQKQINELDDSAGGSFLILEKDWKAANNDVPLVIPAGKTIILNLNGHKIDAKGFTGTVITVNGTLIIRDTSSEKTGVITGGSSAADGGGIYVASTGQLTLESGTISSNKAKGNGGGVYSEGTVTVSGGKISNNSSEKDGGGIYNEGTLTISDGEISDNTAKSSGGAVSIKSGTVTVTGGTMTGNTATTYHGGAIYLKGAVLNLYGGTVTGNKAAMEGGGILYGENSTVNVKGSPVVKDNTAATGKNILIRSGNKISIADALSQDAVLDIAFKGDPVQALTQYYSVTGCVKKNFPYDEGSVELRVGADGELYLPEVVADKTVNTWDELQAELNDNANDGKTIAVGADLNGSDKDRLLLEGSVRNVTIDLCGHTVDLKRTSKGETKHVFEAKGGAALTVKDSLRTGIITGGWADNGGGIYVNNDSTVNLQYVTVRGNKAGSDGGGIYVKGTLNMIGGSVYGNTAGDEGGGIYTSDDKSAVIILNGVEITANTSKKGGGGLYLQLKDNGSSITDCTITHNESKTDGGGLFAYVYSGKALTIDNTHIDSNTAGDEGGGVNISNGTIEMTDCSVSGNKAKSGGAVNIKNNAFYGSITVSEEALLVALSAENTKFNNNTASSEGGGIYTKSVIALNHCEVKNNTASGDGGGLYNDSKWVRSILSDTAVDNNKADGDKNKGGGIYIGAGSVKTVRGSVSENYAGGDGGGIYIDAKDWSNVAGQKPFKETYPDVYTDTYDYISDGTTIKGNTSYKDGGGIYQYKGNAIVKGGSITENQPRVSGGGIYITDNTKMTVENVTFTENKTGYGGSAIYLEDDGELKLYGAAITGNEDGDNSAVYADEDVHIKGKVIVKDNVGGNFYFCHNEEFKLDGALSTDCEIGIELADKVGTFTDGLKKNNPNTDPNTFFVAPADYSVRLDKDGEARLIGSDWIYLQEEIDATPSGGTVTLTKDYTADPIDETLVFPEGKSITLDLNGHTLDKSGSGQVIRVPQTSVLTIKDDSEKHDGVITGGDGFNGGGIYVQGTLTFESGNITGNNASNGGGIFNAGTLTVSGGNITGNTSGHGGGIFNTGTATFESGNIKSNTAKNSGGGIYNKGTLMLKGGKITENTAVEEGGGVTVAGADGKLYTETAPYVKGNNSPSGKNIMLYAGKAVTINGQLSDTAKLDVTTRDYKSALTSGFGESGTEQSVFSYNENDTVILELKSDGELYFPAQFGSDIQWVNNWTELQNAINNATSGKVIGLNADLTPEGQKRIEVKNKTVTIELAGHTIDRGLTEKTDQGNVFKVYDHADLTIRDTVQAGVITGGYANGDGGGFYVIDDAKLTIEGGSISGNSATSDGAGIYVDDATLIMTGGSISGNHSKDNGGGIYTSEDAVITLSNAFITGNTSKYGGGGMNIHLKDSTSTISGCMIAYNKSEKSDGGGISLDAESKTLTVTDTTIGNNTAGDEGGAVYVDHGTFVMDKGLIDGNSAADGGGVYITGGDTFTAKNGAVISNNYTTKYSGGGITCHGFLAINNATVKNNLSARFGGGIFYQNSGETITLTNATITGNLSVDEGGGVYIKQGTVKLVGGSVSSNIAPKGGGVYVTDNTKLDANGVTFEKNTTSLSDDTQASSGETSFGRVDSKDNIQRILEKLKYREEAAKVAAGVISEDNSGAGLFNEGNATLTACTFTQNTADFSGGGVFNKASLTIDGSTLTGNKASEQYGGAVCHLDGNISVTGTTTIQSNTSTMYGNGIFIGKDADSFAIEGLPTITENGGAADIYLSAGKKLTISGSFENNAKIGVALERKLGKFTEDFAAENEGKQPDTYFVSNDGYTVVLEDGEASLMKTEDAEPEFIPVNEQIVDHSKLNGKNWMSGISGERTLNEINFVGTHDSAMANAAWNTETSNLRKLALQISTIGWMLSFTGLGLLAAAGGMAFYWKFGTFGADQATTQTLYINEQMEAGVRSFDLRLNNRVCKSWNSSLEDDGKNLYLCHGKDASGGTFYAMDKDDNLLTFNQVLDWAEEFLEENPSETISISLGAETLDNDTYEPIVMQRAKKILKEYSQHINPSTGKPYIYWEDGDMEKKYTHYPKLKEIRGQILIQSGSEYFGGFEWSINGTIDYRTPNTYLVNQPEERIKDIYSFYGTYGTPDLPTDADTHTDYINKVKMNTTDDSSKYLNMVNPRDMQDIIYAEFFGKGKFFDQHGKYVGLINTDNVSEMVSRYVWESNFFDELEYCTVTVKSGLNNTNLYPDKTYKLLKGTEITIPYSIYTPQNDEGYFQNWRADDTDYFYGDTYKVNSDVTFVGVWGPEIKTPLTVEWNDGDNVDKLRPDSLKISVTNTDDDTVQEIIVDKDDDWMTVITGRADDVIPNWDKITVTAENPQGEHTVGYRYEVEGGEGVGYKITLYHAATKTENIGGTVTWDDEDDKYGRRPESVTLHLYRNGLDTGETRTASAANGWSYSFGDLKVFQNFERTEFTVIEDPVKGYSISSGDYNFTNVFDKSVYTTINGIIYWKDSYDSYGARPDTVTLHLYANGVEIDSQTIRSGDSNITLWDFDVISYELEHLGEDTVYTVTEEPIPGYETTVKAETDEDQDESTARIFTITNEFDTTDKHFKRHSISLNGDIGVNFYLKLTDEELTQNPTVSFKLNNEALSTYTIDAERDAGTVDGMTLYKATCWVCAPEMTDNITAVLTIGGQLVETNRYSVKAYGDTILSDGDAINHYRQSLIDKGLTEEAADAKCEKLIELVTAMLNYGGATQLEFEDEHPNNTVMANAGLAAPAALTPEELDAIDISAPDKEWINAKLDGSGLTYYGYTMLLHSETKLRFYFIKDSKNTDISEIHLSRNGVTYNAQNYNAKYAYVEVPAIPAYELNYSYTLTVGDKNLGSYSALTYVKDVLTDNELKTDDPLVATVTAMYRYHEAAVAWFNNN